jgi:hypothetical protein
MDNLRWVVAISVWCAASACVGPDDDIAPLSVEVEERPNLATSWATYRDTAKAAANGADQYVAEWDLTFPTEAALREHYEQELLAQEEKLAVFQQLSTGYEPTHKGLDALDLVYCVSTTFTNQSTVISDMAAATRRWQRVVNVRFRYDASQNASCDYNNANVDFAVMPTTATPAGCGANKLLWSSGPGCSVAGNTSARGVLSMQYAIIPGPNPVNSGVTPQGVMLHELGHILGFRHEHPWAPSGGGCVETPTLAVADVGARRLTDYDQASVMHYATCNGVAGVDFRLSTLDGRGARSIYHVPAAWHAAIHGPNI